MLMDMTDGIELELRDAAKAASALPPKEREAHAAFSVKLLRAALHYGPLDAKTHTAEWFNDDGNFAHAMQQARHLA